LKSFGRKLGHISSGKRNHIRIGVDAGKLQFEIVSGAPPCNNPQHIATTASQVDDADLTFLIV
jgi:hypothetical protein